ncbi:DUF4190 domain-containing protein [Gordonia sp. X0973]|uniref:DUF4190 domain-containing protein n=1 Tax=Gordonia sp. X0973 TaxID=2742602 RepID=UPI000F5334A6|nr:DUF4190 domain-containing protein [Gordonia sp. X0973]QKT06438.1 DUF4190 domain-containing protein [Gordonia sp. X0973]
MTNLPHPSEPGADDEWSPVNLNKDQASAAPYPEPTGPSPISGPPVVGPPVVGPPVGGPPVVGPPMVGPPPVGGPPVAGYPVPGYPPVPGTPDPYSAAYGYAAYPVSSPKSNGMAIGALVSGLAGFLCCPAGIVALVLGIVALRQINETPEPASGDRGMAIAGIVLGAVFTLIAVVYLVIIIAGAVSS